MIVHVTNIEWDTDENDIPSESLEEMHGYCVKNFAIDT